MLASGGLLSACGGGGGGGSASTSATTSNNPLITVDPSTEPLGMSNGQAVTRLMTVQNVQGYNAIYWGVKDANALPTQLVQMLTWGSDPTNPVRTYFDSAGLPTGAIALQSQYGMSTTWGTNTLTLQFYDASGNLIGGSVVTGNGTAYTIGPLPAQGSQVRLPTSTTVSAKNSSIRPKDATSSTYASNVMQGLGGLLNNIYQTRPWLTTLSQDLATASANTSTLYATGGLLQQLAGTSVTSDSYNLQAQGLAHASDSPFISLPALGIVVGILFVVFLEYEINAYYIHEGTNNNQTNGNETSSITVSPTTPADVPPNSSYYIDGFMIPGPDDPGSGTVTVS